MGSHTSIVAAPIGGADHLPSRDPYAPLLTSSTKQGFSPLSAEQNIKNTVAGKTVSAKYSWRDSRGRQNLSAARPLRMPGPYPPARDATTRIRGCQSTRLRWHNTATYNVRPHPQKKTKNTLEIQQLTLERRIPEKSARTMRITALCQKGGPYILKTRVGKSTRFVFLHQYSV